MDWIKIEKQEMPLETYIIAKHRHGVEAIIFHAAAWRYWYRGDAVEIDTLKAITEWCKPE